jgi:hypothetical protein
MGPHLPRHQKQQRSEPKGLQLPCQKWKQKVTWDPDSAWVDYKGSGACPSHLVFLLPTHGTGWVPLLGYSAIKQKY